MANDDEKFARDLAQYIDLKRKIIDTMKNTGVISLTLVSTGEVLIDLSTSINKTKKKCIVCQVRYPNILLEPCNHLTFCADCHLEYLKEIGHLSECPICRQPVKNSKQVY